MGVVGVFSVASLVMFRKRALARWVTPAALVLSLGAAGMMGYAANLGGMIRHTEIRAPGTTVPVSDGGDTERRER